MKRDAPLLYMQFAAQRAYVVLALGLLVVALAGARRVENSRFGMALLAIKQNEPAAEAAGIDTWRWKMRAIMLSGALAGMAGGLYAVVLLVVTPESVFGMLVSAQVLFLALFGGVGSLWGPVLGAVVLVPLAEGLNGELGDVLPGIQGVVYGVAIILIILGAPEGVYWRLRDRFAKPRAAPLIAAEPVPAVTRSDARPTNRGDLLALRGIGISFGGVRAVDLVRRAQPPKRDPDAPQRPENAAGGRPCVRGGGGRRRGGAGPPGRPRGCRGAARAPSGGESGGLGGVGIGLGGWRGTEFGGRGQPAKRDPDATQRQEIAAVGRPCVRAVDGGYGLGRDQRRRARFREAVAQAPIDALRRTQNYQDDGNAVDHTLDPR